MTPASGGGRNGGRPGEAWVLPAILLAVFVVAAYARPFWIRHNFVGQDILAYNLPLEKAVHDALARGRLPAWSEEVSGGRPLFPNPNSGSLYPVRPLLALVPFPLAMRIFPVVHWIAAGLGMLLLLRQLRCSRGAAWVGAATYTFSGVIVSEVYYSNFQPGATLLPWTLWAMARPAETIGRKAVPLGLTFGLLFLAGDVVSASLAVGAAVLWIVLEAAPSRRGRELVALGLGLSMAALLAAPQILATALMVPQTRRAVSGLRLGEALGFSLSPWRLLELVVPYPWGATWAFDDGMNWGHSVFRCFFATLFCGGLPLIGLLSKSAVHAPGERFSRTLFLGALFLAVAGGLLPRAWSSWPAPIPLRYPEKFAVGAMLAMAVAAGIAFDRYRSRSRRPAGLFPLVVGLALLAAGVWAFPREAGRIAASAVGAAPGSVAQAGAELPAALAVGGLLWAATLVAFEGLRRPSRMRQAGALLLFTAVPFAATRCIPRTASEAAVFPPTPLARTIAKRDPLSAYRAIDESLYRASTPMLERSLLADPYHVELQRQAWYCHTPALWGRGLVFNADLDRGDLSRLETLRRISARAAEREDAAPFFATLGLRFGTRFRDQAALPGFEAFGGDAFRIWDENRSALPTVRLLERWREEASGVGALEALPQLESGEVVLETGRKARGRARRGTVRFVERTPERWILEVNAPDATWLFAVRGYWDYRTVRVDGLPVECVPAQLAFSAVPVPAGEHRITWREEIPGGRVSVAGPALFVLLSAFLWLRGRERPSSARESTERPPRRGSA